MPKRSYSKYATGQMLKVARKLKAKIRLGSARRGRASRTKLSRVAPSRNCHSFKRFTADTRVNTTGTTSSHAIEYAFQNIINPNDFADLYDRYMITCVVHRFRLVNNPNATIYNNGTNTTGNTVTLWNASSYFPKLWYCPDYDDSATETLQEMQQRAKTKCMVLQPNKQYKIVVKPAVTIQTYRTTTTTGYAPKWKQWIDMGQRDVPHYGLKFVVDTSAQDPVDVMPYIVEYTTQYFFKCKDVR